MNTILLNTVSLDGGTIIKKGSGGGGVAIKNQEKSVEITENGVTEVAPDSGFTGLSKVVVNTNVASGGGGATEPKPVNDVTFYDYDGVVLYSYTKDEFLAMSEMPPLPTRKGLICQEWNYNFEDAVEYVRDYGKFDVGATYITDDGKTRLYIRIAAEGRMDVPLYFNQSVDNGVAIDWGDGSATQTLSGSGNVNTTHHYNSIGNYCITLDVADGCNLKIGSGSNSFSIFGKESFHKTMLKKVEIGERVNTVSSYAFNSCYSLASIVIPKGVTSIGNYAFQHCPSLASIVISNSVTSIGDYAFSSCSSIANVIIPHGVTRIRDYVFSSCYSIANIVIPHSVTSISKNAFSYCYGMAFYDFSQATVVPSIQSYSFDYMPSDCKIIVPDALYDEWIAATNWSTYASNIIKKSDWDASQS